LNIDLTELDLPKTMLMEFPVKEDLLNFELYITPDEGENTEVTSQELWTHNTDKERGVAF
jgi:hypothetical protein